MKNGIRDFSIVLATLDGGHLSADRALEDAVKEACEVARTETGLPLFYGTPEA